jgi:nucleotide-binding universal stress UspA family protein
VKILLAMDGSRFSEAASQATATQVRPQSAEVLVVHVIEPPTFLEQDASLRERSAHAQELLNKAVQELHAAGFKGVTTRVMEAEPRTGILEAAALWHADLIVLGSHGRKGLEKLMLGSVAESVARHAPCSVLIVRIPSTH